MEQAASHILPLCGMTFLFLAGAGGWLSALRRLPGKSPASPTPLYNYPNYLDDYSDFSSEKLIDQFYAHGAKSWTETHPAAGPPKDFFKVWEANDNVVNFYLGDICGKGLPATLFQVSCTTLLSQASGVSLDPLGVVSEVNGSLAQRELDGRYATLLYGSLDLTSGRLRLVSAGHPSPLRLRPDGQAEVLRCEPGLPLGIQGQSRFAQSEFHLEPGDTVLLFTDGITDTRNLERVPFGIGSLQSAAENCPVACPRLLVEEVFDEVKKYGDSPGNDRTAMAIQFQGRASGFETNKLDLPYALC